MLAIIFMIMTGGGKGITPVSVGAMGDPSGVVESFFRALAEGDFAAADDMVSNYASLGLERTVSGSSLLGDYMYEQLFDSYDLSKVGQNSGGEASPSDLWRSDRSRMVFSEGDYTVEGRSAELTARLTVLDSEKLTARLSDIARYMGERQAKLGEQFDTEEKALALFDSAMEQLKGEPVDQLYSSADVTVKLVFVGGRWQIYMTDEMYGALMGKLPADNTATAASDSDGGAANE